MPFTIHIPPHRLPTLLFLTPSNTTKISISTSSPLAQKIAADAEKWGWRVERTEVGEKEWRKYVEEAGRKGWFKLLYKTWQREHGLRIAHTLPPPASTTRRSRLFNSMRDFAREMKTRTTKHTASDRERYTRGHADGGTHTPSPAPETPRRTVSLPDLLPTSTISISDTSALEDRLAMLGLEGKAREGYIQGFMTVEMRNEGRSEEGR